MESTSANYIKDPVVSFLTTQTPKKIEGIPNITTPKFMEYAKALKHKADPVYYETFDNGCSVLIKYQPSTANDQPKASINVVILTGNLDEEYPAQKQFSHMVEHSVLGFGTENFPLEQIRALNQSLGCIHGIHDNAETHERYTRFFWNIDLLNEEKVKKLLQFTYEIVSRAIFPKEKVEKELQVVKEELLKRKSVTEIFLKWFLKNVSPNEDYIKAIPDSVEKSPEEEKQVHETLCNFYKANYVPSKMCLIASVGDQKYVKLILDEARSLFGKIPKNEVIPRKIVSETSWRNGRFVLPFIHPEIPLDHVEIFSRLHHPPKKLQLPQKRFAEFSPATTSFFGAAQAMLNQAAAYIFANRFGIFDDKKPLLKPTFSLDSLTHDSVFFKWSFVVKEKKFSEAFESCLIELKRLLVYGIMDKELKFFKKVHIKQLKAKEKNIDQTTQVVAANYLVNSFISSSFPFDQKSHLQGQVELAKKLTKEDVFDFIKQNWNIFSDQEKESLTIVIKSSQNVDLEIEKFLEILDKIKNFQPEPAKDIPIDLDWIPRSFPIAKSKKIENISINIQSDLFVLDLTLVHFNNTQVVLVPDLKDSSEIKISLIIPEAFRRGGNNKKWEHALTIGLLAFAKTGIGDRDLRSISQSLLPFFITPMEYALGLPYGLLTMTVKKEQHLDLALKAFYTKLYSIKENEIEFKKFCEHFIDFYIQIAQQQASTRKGNFDIALQNAIYGHYKLLSPLKNEDLKINPEDCLSAFYQFINDLSFSSVLICGKFDPVAIIPSLENTVGNLQSVKESYPALAPYKFPEGKIVTELFDGEDNGKSQSTLVFPIISNTSDKSDAVRILCSAVLKKYLYNELREREQLVYGVDASIAKNSLQKGDDLFEIKLVSSTTTHSRVIEKTLSCLDKLTDEKLSNFENTFRSYQQLRRNYYAEDTKKADYIQQTLTQHLGNSPSFSQIIDEIKNETELTLGDLKPIIDELSQHRKHSSIIVTLNPIQK